MNNQDTLFHANHEKFSDLAYKNNLLPDRYVFVLTNQCNLNCDFCFQQKEKNSESLTTQHWVDVIEQLPEYARVTFTGGEPLMFEGFEEIFKKVSEKYTCNLISNGLLLTDKIIDLLLSSENFKVLSISIEDKQNKYRGVRYEKWKKAEEQIKKFVAKKKEKGHPALLDIKTVILDENAHDLYEMYSYAKNTLYCDTHAFQFLKGSPLQHSDTMYSFEAMMQKSSAYVYRNFKIIKEQLSKVAQLNPKQTFIHPKFIELTSNANLDDLDKLNSQDMIPSCYEACKFPWSSVHINYDGNLYPCMAITMGNVKVTSLKEIIFGEEFTKFKNTIKRSGTVQGCNRCGWLRLKP